MGVPIPSLDKLARENQLLGLRPLAVARSGSAALIILLCRFVKRPSFYHAGARVKFGFGVLFGSVSGWKVRTQKLIVEKQKLDAVLKKLLDAPALSASKICHPSKHKLIRVMATLPGFLAEPRGTTVDRERNPSTLPKPSANQLV